MLANPLVDEEGSVILPSKSDGTTDSGKQPGNGAADKSSTPPTAAPGYDQAAGQRDVGAQDEAQRRRRKKELVMLAGEQLPTLTHQP